MAEIKENHRETEQRLGGLFQPRPDETSPSAATVAEQTLPDPPLDVPEISLDLPDVGMIDDHVFHDIEDIEENTERIEGPRADSHLLKSELTSEPDARTKDRKDGRKTNQEEDLSVGQPQDKSPSKKARALANRTCPHCRKVFPGQSSCDRHIKQGCASLNPPRDLECRKCLETFETKKLLHRHIVKGLCSVKAEPESLAGNEGSQSLQDILSQADAEFRKREASNRSNFTFADDWSLPQRQETRPQATAAEQELDKSAGEYRSGDVGFNIQTDPETNDEENATGATEATVEEDIAKVLDNGSEMRAGEDSDEPLIRKIGKGVRIIRNRKKEHRRGDMVLVEDASSLGVDSLGKAAEVIVLRDGGQWVKKASPVEVSSEEAMDSGLKIEDFLDEQDVLSPDDVVGNIHGLKPERQIVSAREFKSLFNTLLDGFTILQLEAYVVWHRERSIMERVKDEAFDEDEALSEEPTIPEDVLPKLPEYAWMTEQARWTPHVDGAVEEAQYPLAGYIMKSMPPKQRLVIQLMRECWDISIQELLNGNGRVDIRVRDLEFKLLTREYSTVNKRVPCSS